MDVGSLELGVSFVDWIRSRLDSCRVMLVVMGEDWAGRRDDGSSRLDDPEDWVRIEVETALGRGIYVIPILVDDAEFPREEDLPGSLVELRTRTGLRVTNARFRPDIEPVLDRVEDLLAGEPGA